MASTTETPRQTDRPRPRSTGCGSCTYVYNVTDGCYHRQSFGCTGNCTCSPIICGLGSQLIQGLYPESVKSSFGVSLTCSSSGSDEESCAKSLLAAIRSTTDRTTFWKRACIGLAVLSGLLAIGLVVALVYR